MHTYIKNLFLLMLFVFSAFPALAATEVLAMEPAQAQAPASAKTLAQAPAPVPAKALAQVPTEASDPAKAQAPTEVSDPAKAQAPAPVPVKALAQVEHNDNDFVVSHPKVVGEGELFVLHISNKSTIEDLTLLWLDKEISLVGQGNNVELMLPVPLEFKDEAASLLLLSAQGYRVYSALIEVHKKEFPVQSLNVDPRFVTPPESEIMRIQAEANKNRAIYAIFTPERYWSAPLVRPLSGIITSEFGVRRLFNNEPRNRHRGLDFRGATGTEIRSLAAGKVVLAENQYYSGNIIILDHGLGVYSNYCHMSAFEVELGEVVTAGQVLGLVGQTGRVTGPHLHLGFMVLGLAVTPEPLMPSLRLVK